MKIDKSLVSGSRFMFAIAFYLQSSALLTSFLAAITKHESWIPVMIGIVLSIPLIFLYRTFMVMFPDKNLLQILDEVYGTVIGKIIGLSYIWYFLTLTAANVLDIGDFTKMSILPETPSMVLMLCCVLMGVWAVRYGFKVVGRYGSVFTIVEFAIVAVTIVLVFDQIDLRSFLPLFSQPTIKYVQGTHIVTTIPFGELIVFLMITPCVEKLSPKKATKYWFMGTGMGILLLLVVLLRDISVLGNALHLFTLPGLVTLRLVSIGEALNRVEIIFTTAVIMLLFFKITLLIYVSTIAISQIFQTVQFKHLALIVGILIVFYAPTLYPSSVEHAISARTIVPFIWTLFEILLPLLTFILAKVRKLPKPAGVPIAELGV